MPDQTCPDNTIDPYEHTWTHSKNTGRRWCTWCGEHAPGPIRVNWRSDLQYVADQLDVASDWHEPSEVTARVGGHRFDNAGFWPESNCSPQINASFGSEMYVELSKNGVPVAQVNLATLFAMACGTIQ